MKNLIIFLIIVIQSSVLFAQSPTTYNALNQFLNTDFFNEYEEIRQRAEKSVLAFKAIQGNYSEEEIQNVKDAYDASANYFNSILENIRRDLLIKDKRRYMITYPGDYSKQIEADLYRAKNYYENTYQKEIRIVTDDQIIVFSPSIINIIRYAGKAFKMLKIIQNEINKFNEGLLQKHLIEPYQFKSWDEIN